MSGLRAYLPRRADLKADILAGLPVAVAAVPDGMAASVLAGVGPVHGLYASFAGPVGGGLVTSSRRMVVTTTSAAALAAGSAVQAVPANDRGGAVVLVTLLAGLVMIAAGLLRLGRYTRFVSYSVILGFLTGVACNIVLGQIPGLTGAPATGGFPLARALDVLAHPGRISWPSVATGLAAIAILVVSRRFRPLAVVGAVLALVVPTVVVSLLGGDVATVSDAGTIPAGFPLPAFPDLGRFSWSLVGGAFAIAAIVLVQGVGVAEAAPNLDGSRSDVNRDFVAQGVGNLTSGAFRGQPVGGSVGQTALSVASGARSRWGGVFSGLWMLLILVAFSGLVGKVLLPTLAGVLIVAAIGSLRLPELVAMVRASRTSAVAAIATLVATLLLPVAVAVGIGVVLSLMLQLNQEAMDLRVVELVRDERGLRERQGPPELADDSVTVLDVYGSVLYAGARTLQARLPDPSGVHRPAVVLRMRGRTAVGTTFVMVVDDYVQRLERVGGKLFLSGLAPSVVQTLDASRRLHGRAVELFEAQDYVGESTGAAVDSARRWLADDPE